MSAILRIKVGGNWIDVPAVKGTSAYESAVAAGYTGTELEFQTLLYSILTEETMRQTQEGIRTSNETERAAYYAGYNTALTGKADITKMFYPNSQYGGIVVTDCNTPEVNGFYSALSTAANVPSASYDWLILHLNSNLGTTDGYQRAVAVSSTPIIYERTKVSSIWGAWSRTVAPATLPTGDGAYLLKCTILNGAPTYSWEPES